MCDNVYTLFSRRSNDFVALSAEYKNEMYEMQDYQFNTNTNPNQLTQTLTPNPNRPINTILYTPLFNKLVKSGRSL